MTGAETTIVHLHVKSLPAKYFVHQPNIFRKKSFFLTAANTVMPKMSPISLRFNDKSCKIRVHSHSCSMPPCWIDFRCLKSLQASKTMFVYPLLGRHQAQTSGFSKIGFRGLGTSFQNKYGVHKQTVFEYIKQPHKPATRTQKSPRSTEKWIKTLTTDPVPHSKIPFTSGKGTNFSVIVLVSLRVFCPKICVYVKQEYLETCQRKNRVNKNPKILPVLIP